MKTIEMFSGGYTLRFSSVDAQGYGLTVLHGEQTVALDPKPARLFAKKPTAVPEEISVAYGRVEEADGTITALASVETSYGGIFAFTDVYRAEKEGSFLLERTVRVVRQTPDHAGFASGFSLNLPGKDLLEQVNCFAPGAWYQKNEFVPPHFIGYQKNLPYHWFFETQYALPMFAVQDPGTGETVCLSRPKADVGMRRMDQGFHNHQVDETVTFGSIGVSLPGRLSLDYVYPGARGTRTRPLPQGWALEPEYCNQYHPAREGYEDHYSVMLDFACEPDYAVLIKSLWRKVYERIAEPVVDLDNELLYKNCMLLLKAQTRNYEGSFGLPFSSSLPEAEPMNVAYQFGFVGQQPNIGYQLIRYGTLYNDEEALEKGLGIIRFWAENSLSDRGIPRIWYNPALGEFEDRPVWIRMIGDGMEGILDAYVFLAKRGRVEEGWLKFCRTAADWLILVQNEDGSWYRSYDRTGAMLMESKANTSNAVRFLVQLYLVTQEEKYRQAALRAGEWSLENITKHLEYRGGTCDNSDVYDKESGIYAMFFYLSIYDLTKEERWLNAAKAAADYTETWTYAWSFPVDVPYPNNPLSKRNISGQSLIATGHSSADVYMASCPYLYYRLYVMTKDPHYLAFARFIHKNSKQCTDYDGSFGYKYPGLCHESGGFSEQKYTGAYHWLPWCAYVQVDPISRLKDTFGAYEIDEAEKLPWEERVERNDIYRDFAAGL